MAYNKNFIMSGNVELPTLAPIQLEKFSKRGLDYEVYKLDYINYSLLQNPFRRLPYYTAANIDGELFRQVDRKGSWMKDSRIPNDHQLGLELYKANKSDFDKGHMTKREDVQWALNDNLAQEAAISTFYYTNSVPQMTKLNRSLWRRIENYILHDEGVEHKLKLCAFTGPVLNNNDPYFVTKVDDEKIQIPRIFWKVIYYVGKTSKLSRVAFITNQSNLLQIEKIVEPRMEIYRSASGEDDFFLDFKDADTYQTDVAVIAMVLSKSFC